MSEKPKTKTQTTTVDGGTDFSGVEANDLVQVGPEGGRRILLPAGTTLTENRQPISEMPDGAEQLLNGGRVVKLGGEILARTEPSQLPPPSVEK